MKHFQLPKPIEFGAKLGREDIGLQPQVRGGVFGSARRALLPGTSACVDKHSCLDYFLAAGWAVAGRLVRYASE